ncbi:hypothetical protein J6590_071098 [Homalodisca vitripennis]|nr:hypothetical protein J6590_071098 [Homalodisca vitripennis]
MRLLMLDEYNMYSAASRLERGIVIGPFFHGPRYSPGRPERAGSVPAPLHTMKRDKKLERRQ